MWKKYVRYNIDLYKEHLCVIPCDNSKIEKFSDKVSAQIFKYLFSNVISDLLNNA